MSCWVEVAPAPSRLLQRCEPARHLPGQRQHPWSAMVLIYRDAKAMTEAMEGGGEAWKELVVQNKKKDNGVSCAGFSIERLLFSQKDSFLKVHKAARLKEHLFCT